jgi:hypothetical protein
MLTFMYAVALPPELIKEKQTVRGGGFLLPRLLFLGLFLVDYLLLYTYYFWMTDANPE